jgi:hypothetical protein
MLKCQFLKQLWHESLNFINLPNPTSHTRPRRFARPLIEMSARDRNKSVTEEWSMTDVWAWKPHHHLWADCLDNVAFSISHNPIVTLWKWGFSKMLLRLFACEFIVSGGSMTGVQLLIGTIKFSLPTVSKPVHTGSVTLTLNYPMGTGCDYSHSSVVDKVTGDWLGWSNCYCVLGNWHHIAWLNLLWAKLVHTYHVTGRNQHSTLIGVISNIMPFLNTGNYILF